jgi:ribulose-5-phosphate 4-epimerase/fuculose-1-phosphate aldolase
MADTLAAAKEAVALGNRILANEGVLDAFGHVSVRHPRDPNRYLLSRSRAPELVDPDDVLEYDLDSNVLTPTNQKLYAERVIHGEIYKARPDVMAVVHHHAPAIMPFCITGTPLVPVFHLGATAGASVPFWDQYEEFGATNLLVVKPEEGASLARALGNNNLVLMNRHGATATAGDVQGLVFRTIYSCRNAEFQFQAQAIGKITPLHPGEVEKASALNAMANVTTRTWEYWVMRLERSGNGLSTARLGIAKKKRTKAGGKKPAKTKTNTRRRKR